MMTMNHLALYRIFRIVWMSVKFFTQVTLFQKRYRGRFTPTVQNKWEILVTKQAEEFKRTALSLGGLLIKVGQFLSTRADIMPQSFIEILEGLTDRVPPVPKKQAISLLEAEWNTSYHDTLLSLSEDPIASASIGEVYKGQLKNGTIVAIKIQRPNIERIIRVDFQAMKIVIWLAKKFTTFSKQINFDILYKEMVQIIGAELNFLQELRNGQSFAERFATMEGVKFPIYYEEYSTRRVLVMEWIEGSRVTDLTFLQQHNLDRRIIAERVFKLFLEQILVGGQFHADPHGGNILIKSDGTIVLIDFGMIGHITAAQTKSVSKLVEGIIFKNYDTVLDSLQELNFLLPNANRQLIADAIERLVKAYESNELQQMDSFVIERLLEDIQQIVRKEPVQMPAEFAFFGRAISTFVGVVHVLDPKVDLFALAKPRVMEWAKSRSATEETKKFFSTNDVLRIAKNIILPLRGLPSQISNYLEEPIRLRQYIQQRDEDERKERARLQTRQFAGIISIIAIISLLLSIWYNHLPLLIASSMILLLSGWLYYKI